MARKLSNRGAWLATATVVLLTGCYRHPKLDVESLPCTSNDNCPAGSSCDLQTQRCSVSGSSRSDAGGSESGSNPGVEAGHPAADGAGWIDGASMGEVGSEAGRGVDGSGSSAYDTTIDGNGNVPPDAPVGDSPLGQSEAGGFGGSAGSGGASGSGAAIGAGGVIGGGGAVGTGGAILGEGGVIGTGGSAPGGNGAGGAGTGGIAAGGATGEGGAGTGGVGSGGAGDGGSAGVGTGGVPSTGGASTSPDAAITGGTPGSGGSVGTGGNVGTGGTGGTGAGGATGTPADIQASTTTLALGDAPMGESSGEGTFTLTNLGQQTSAPIHLTSTNTDFVIRTTGDNTCISDTTTLAQNASCTVRVVLTATSLGSKSGSITFQAGSGPSAHVSVSGTGTAGASLSTGATTSISFPQLATAGVPSPVTSFTITNVGPRTSGTISATSDNADFAVQTGVAGDCTGATLLPNGTCTVRVIMTASMSGSISGRISVSAIPGGTAGVNASGMSCAANAHNDGTGNCASLYTCATNYHNGGTGKCVPNQTCPTDQLTDDTGTCVPVVGVNWVKRSIQALYVAMSGDGQKAIAAGSQHVYTSTSGGEDWVERTLPTTENWTAVGASPDGKKLWVFGPSTSYSSIDSGANWTRWSGGGITSFASSADGTKWIAGESGSYVVLYDVGAGSTSVHQSSATTPVAISSDGTTLVAGDGVNVRVSADSGQTWSGTQQNNSYPTATAVACSADGTSILAVGYMVCFSQTSGKSWQPCWGPNYLNNRPVAAVSATAEVLVYSGFELSISRDYGKTWKTTATADPVTALAISADGTKMLAIEHSGSSDFVYTSTGPVP